MIAVISTSKRCVWGIGPNVDDAWQDARSEIAGKAPAVKPELSTLSVANLSSDADLDCDGETMWQWVVLDQAAPAGGDVQQMGLFEVGNG